MSEDSVIAKRAAEAALNAAFRVLGEATQDKDRFNMLLAVALGIALDDASGLDPRIGDLAARVYLRVTRGGREGPAWRLMRQR